MKAKELREKTNKKLLEMKKELELQLMKNKAFMGVQTSSGKSKTLAKGVKSNKKVRGIIATINLILHERKNG